MERDIRWKQRFENYQKAFLQLRSAVKKYKEYGLNDFEKQGLIQAFEYTFELSWNLLRDYFIYQCITDIRGSRDAIKTAVRYGLIKKGELWLKMISARNLTSRTYNENIVEGLLKEIVEDYYEELEKPLNEFAHLKDDRC